MAILLTICFLLITLSFFGQTDTIKPKKDTRPVKVSLLGGYYDQDGDHSAVNGGTGSQELFSNTMESMIYIPLKDSSAVKVDGGFDYFTSASMLKIDKYMTSASSGTSNVSGDELRTYAHLSFDLASKKKGMLFTPSIGFSNEYDVRSINTGLAWSKNLNKRMGNYTVGLNFISDRWMMVYPGEFRAAASEYTSGASPIWTSGASTGSGSTSGEGSGGDSGNMSGYNGIEKDSGEDSGSTSGNTSGSTSGGTTTSGASPVYTGSGSTSGSAYESPQVSSAVVIPVTGKTIEKDGKTYPVDWRYSLSLSNGYTYVINRKMNAAVGIDLTAQWGMLSTPFHRVYFNDGVKDDFDKEVRIEKLPELRLKSALYARYNYSVNAYLKLRAYARYYYDTWDIHALAVTVETPVKVTNWLTITPFYRLSAQKESKYFAPYGEHTFRQGDYYTSDYDLSKFTSHKVGGAIRFAPLKPIAGIRNPSSGSYLFAFKTAGVRYSAYTRSDGLSAQAVTFELTFEL